MIYANRRASGLIPPTNIQPLMKSLQSWRSGSSAESRICNFIVGNAAVCRLAATMAGSFAQIFRCVFADKLPGFDLSKVQVGSSN
jgi:hypothetical protein